MKIRDQELIVVHFCLADRNHVVIRKISYDDLKKLLKDELAYLPSGEEFYSSKYIVNFEIHFNLFEKVEKLVKLEEENKQAELIIAKKELIDDLIKEKQYRMNEEYHTFLNEIIDDLKR